LRTPAPLARVAPRAEPIESDAPATRVAAVPPPSESAQPWGVPFACSPPCRAVRAGRTICFTLYWDTTLGSSQRTTIINGGADGRYLRTGHIVYALGSTLFAVPFDVQHLEVVGAAVPVVEGIARGGAGAAGVAQFAVSPTGTLADVPGQIFSGSEKLDLAL